MLSVSFEAVLTKQYLNQEHSNSVSSYALFYVIQDENIGWKVILVAACKEQIMQVSSWNSWSSINSVSQDYSDERINCVCPF